MKCDYTPVDMLVLNWMQQMEQHFLQQQRLTVLWELIEGKFGSQISEKMKQRLLEWSSQMEQIAGGELKPMKMEIDNGK